MSEKTLRSELREAFKRAEVKVLISEIMALCDDVLALGGGPALVEALQKRQDGVSSNQS